MGREHVQEQLITDTQPSLHDATRCKHRKLNPIFQVSWESTIMPKRLKFTSNKKTQGRKPPAASQTKQQPPSAGHTATPRKQCGPARATLALIQTKEAPHAIHN